MKTLAQKARAAFTLIEMLIVVAIIGILVGIGVPALRDAKKGARNAKINSALAQVATAKTRYMLDEDVTGTVTILEADLLDYLLVNGTPVTDVDDLLGDEITGTIVIGDSRHGTNRPIDYAITLLRE